MTDLVITAALLARAARRNGFAVPSQGLVFFGIRGLSPGAPFDNAFGASRTGRFSPVDFVRMNCTLGQWNVDKDEIAVFPGSTVPSRGSISNAMARGGSGTNMLMLGRFEYEKGMHKGGKPNGHRAFRQASFFPVWRTVDNLFYDLADKIDFGDGPGSFVWDNLHSAYWDTLEHYSSAGCQVVCGLPRSPNRNNQPETGPWRVFVENAYNINQNRFVYLLFSAEELALLDNATDLTQLVRFGSSGRAAKDVQAALVQKGLLDGAPDGVFGRSSLRALTEFQAKTIGPTAADGICGAGTAAALGVTLPPLAGARPAPQPNQPPQQPTSDNPDLEDETDLDPETLRILLAALGIQGATPAPAPTPAVMGKETPASPRANFERAQAIIRDFEGGFTNDPKDPGGATNFGITQETLSRWRKRPVSEAEVAAMTYEEAKEIFFAEYWSRSSCDAMPGPLALPVYNIAVHAGVGTAARFLQLALNSNGASVTVDGGIGGETLGAIKQVPLPELISDLIDLYEARLRAHKEFAHFKNGFLNRVTRLRTEAERWLAETGVDRQPIPTPKVAEQGDETVTQLQDLIADLLKIVNPAQPGVAPPGAAPAPQPGVATPGVTPPADKAALAELLRRLADSVSGQPTLTPVNGALGPWLGKLLDGKKSALGIIGALLSSLLSPTAAGVSPLTGLLTSIFGSTALGGFLSTAGPILLPIFLGLAAWGGLGKLDKYAAQQK
jgi:lysozyme family protein